MPGPVDLRDWADDGYHLRSAIRMLPIVQRFGAQPKAVRSTMDGDLADRLARFNQGSPMASDSLNQLYADLTRTALVARPQG